MEAYLVWGNSGHVPSKNMQTKPLEVFAPIFMKDAHSDESNEKSIFRFLRFLIFELWLITFIIYQKYTDQNKSCSKVFKFTGKMRKKMRIALKIIFHFESFFLCDF